jgi:hypothetical protein
MLEELLSLKCLLYSYLKHKIWGGMTFKHFRRVFFFKIRGWQLSFKVQTNYNASSLLLKVETQLHLNSEHLDTDYHHWIRTSTYPKHFTTVNSICSWTIALTISTTNLLQGWFIGIIGILLRVPSSATSYQWQYWLLNKKP